ncbi:MAG TPA: ABC transporter ATP-binding protein [Candidatus Acidoferrum sp.]|nr:ABC transporter ATP-binding protein [Candidatus Acidoferrum sp.]
MGPILEVRDLQVAYRSRSGDLFRALEGVSFCVEPGEVLGILGESGSGKSTLAVSLLGLFPRNSVVANGAVLFQGRDLLKIEPEQLQAIRGKSISLIFQEPSVSLHPTMRVGRQVRQVLVAHRMRDRDELDRRTTEVFETLFGQDAERIERSYPHQLSGGQRQRVLIAQAIACRPSVVVADEPTASLDPTTQMEILSVFRELRKSLGLTMIFITHNPALLSGFADRVLVLYGGRVVELGPATGVLASPKHPYTQALFRSIPSLDEPHDARKRNLPAIPRDSNLSSPPRSSCPFEPRCPERMETCKSEDPRFVNLSDSHVVSCFKYEGQ